MKILELLGLKKKIEEPKEKSTSYKKEKEKNN